MLTGSDLLA